MTIEQILEDLHALGKDDAEVLADAIFDALVDALQHDHALPARLSSEWWTRLANVRAGVVDQIHHVIDEHVDRADVLRDLRDEITEQG
jgi:hypothetical protein